MPCAVVEPPEGGHGVLSIPLDWFEPFKEVVGLLREAYRLAE